MVSKVGTMIEWNEIVLSYLNVGMKSFQLRMSMGLQLMSTNISNALPDGGSWHVLLRRLRANSSNAS